MGFFSKKKPNPKAALKRKNSSFKETDGDRTMERVPKKEPDEETRPLEFIPSLVCQMKSLGAALNRTGSISYTDDQSEKTSGRLP